MDPELEAFITQAMLEVERDLSLPANSLVDATPLPEMKEKVTLKTLEVRLDPHFMATIPAKYTHHSKELRLRKKVAEQEKTISLLTSTLELQQKTYDLLVNVMGAQMVLFLYSVEVVRLLELVLGASQRRLSEW